MTAEQLIYYCIGHITVDALIAVAVLNAAYAVHRRHCDKISKRTAAWHQAEAAKAQNREEIKNELEE